MPTPHKTLRPTHLSAMSESRVPTTRLGTSTRCGFWGASARCCAVPRAILLRVTSTASPRLGTVSSQYSGEAILAAAAVVSPGYYRELLLLLLLLLLRRRARSRLSRSGGWISARRFRPCWWWMCVGRSSVEPVVCRPVLG